VGKAKKRCKDYPGMPNGFKILVFFIFMLLLVPNYLLGACTYDIMPQECKFGPSTGTGSIAVRASSDSCSWTATKSDAWITVSSANSGTGSGALTYNVAANATGNKRVGTIAIEGQTFTISQYSPDYNLKGDVHNDWKINLDDAIVALRMVTRQSLSNINKGADVNNDGVIGIPEAIYVLQLLQGTVDPVPITKKPAIKGFWKGAQGTIGTSAIVLANGDSWLVFQESGISTSFARLQIQTNGLSYSGTGTQYFLTSGTAQNVSTVGTFTEKASLLGTAVVVSGSASMALAYSPEYETTATLADAAGNWVGSYNGGASSATIAIAENGALTGSSTTGCTYSGTMQMRSTDPALFDVSFTESCVDGDSKALAGIATVNAARTSLSLAATTDDRLVGMLFLGTK
jgi:hypothetical protein